MAAKRSRDARRLKENQIALRAGFLEKEVCMSNHNVHHISGEVLQGHKKWRSLFTRGAQRGNSGALVPLGFFFLGGGLTIHIAIDKLSSFLL